MKCFFFNNCKVIYPNEGNGTSIFNFLLVIWFVHGVAAGNVATWQLQGPWFDPAGQLSVWSFVFMLKVSCMFSGFLSLSKNIQNFKNDYAKLLVTVNDCLLGATSKDEFPSLVLWIHHDPDEDKMGTANELMNIWFLVKWVVLYTLCS